MKQIVLGILCCAIAVYTIISCLSIYSISCRRNEMENCVAQVLRQNLELYYVRPVPEVDEPEDEEDEDDEEKEGEEDEETDEEEPEIPVPIRLYSDAQVAAFVRQDLTSRLRSDSKINIEIYACDMELGILSAGVSERFFLPNGMEKVLSCSKTIIVE